jgi:hypothetical protein
MTTTRHLSREPLWYLKGLPYGDYLQTDHWKITRQDYLDAFDGELSCERYGLSVIDEVSYERKYHYRNAPGGDYMEECRSDAAGAMETYDWWVEDRPPRFNVHHLTYERLGEEHPDDLLLLCSPCHNLEHNPDSHAAVYWKEHLEEEAYIRSLNGKAGHP